MKRSTPWPAARAASCSSSRVADAVSLVLVGDCESDLGGQGLAKPDVVRDRDDPLLACVHHRAHESSAIGPVRIEHGLDETLVHRRAAVETQVQAAGREVGEEPDEGVPIAGARRTKPKGAPIPEDDVDGFCGGVGLCHWPRAPDSLRGSWTTADAAMPLTQNMVAQDQGP